MISGPPEIDWSGENGQMWQGEGKIENNLEFRETGRQILVLQEHLPYISSISQSPFSSEKQMNVNDRCLRYHIKRCMEKQRITNSKTAMLKEIV